MKRFKISVLLATLTALALLVSGAGLLHSQNAQDLYQKALSQEKTQGNLQQAIALHQKVIAGAGADRALAARAQYHIGLCYEKMGAAEAEKAFRKVIDQYPEQKDSVTAANERLAQLAITQSASRGTGIRRVFVPDGYPSPDGRFFAYEFSHDSRKPGVKWDYDDIKLHEVATGKDDLIADLSSFESSVVDTITWSPSGKRIAFIVSQGRMPLYKDHLCVVGSDGSDFKILYQNTGQGMGIAGWLPDESAIIVSIRKQDDSRTIAEVALKSATLREIKQGMPTGILSPDGRFLAYQMRNPENLKWDIGIISLNSTSDGYVIQHPANDSLLHWSPDSRYLLFRSDRSGVPAIWLQEVGNGRPIGSPSLIFERENLYFPLGMTKNGSFYFAENETRYDVSIAQVDLTTGRTLKPTESIDPFYSGNKHSPVWSRNGEQIAYFIAKGSNYQAPSLRIHPVAGGKDREVTVDLTDTTFGAMMPVPWWHEDNFIYAYGGKQIEGKPQNGIYRIDIRSGHSEFVSSGYAGAFLPNNQFAVLLRRNNAKSLSEGQSSLLRKDLNSGNENPIITGEIGQSISQLTVSPDGKWIGYSMRNTKDHANDAFYVAPASGGSAQQLLSSAEKDGMLNSSFFWGPVGSILFKKQGREDIGEAIRRELWYMPTFDATRARKLDLEIPDLRTLTFHPDGKTIAFTSQVNERKVWVMENYLPAKK